MKKKDIVLVGGILFVAVVLYLGIHFWSTRAASHAQTEWGYVYHQDQIILAFDIHQDKIYDFTGSYGEMHLEVKDGKWRIFNEDCPNHICSSMGWVGPEDLYPIVCVPNEVYVSYEGEREE